MTRRTRAARAAGAAIALTAALAPASGAWAAGGPTATGAPGAMGASRATAGDAPTLHGGWVGEAAARRGTTARLAGTTSQPVGVVRVDRRVSGRWVAAGSAAVSTRSSSAGSWSVTVRVPGVPSAQTYRIVWVSGRAPLASAVLPTLDVYELDTYSVRTRGRVSSDVSTFARFAAATYADPRGWARAHHRFRQVRSGGDFTLVLAQASTLPRYSPVCSVRYSCRVGRNVVINDTPWRARTPAFTGDLTAYRRMVVNHETGHWLGLSHRSCPARGALAPVMQQQSKSMQGCRANSWPLPGEVARVR